MVLFHQGVLKLATACVLWWWQAIAGPWEEDPGRRTDQAVEELAMQMVRQALLNRLHQVRAPPFLPVHAWPCEPAQSRGSWVDPCVSCGETRCFSVH